MGCLFSIFKWIYTIFITLFLFFVLLGAVIAFFDIGIDNQELTENNQTENSLKSIDYSEIPANFMGEYDSIQPCRSTQKLLRFTREWNNENNQIFRGKFILATQLACQAENHREKINEPNDYNAYWQIVYAQLYAHDYAKMPKIYERFAQIGKDRRLNSYQFAEMVLNFVQGIPYILVHPNTCAEDRKRNAFSDTYHRDGLPCLPNRRFGLQSPLEFMYNLKGDCDTRALFAYTVLSHFGYDVVVLGSSRHAMLGINLPANGHYLIHKGKKYYFWETTAKGYTLGMIPPEYQRDDWAFSLFSQRK
jgi:hypothetical protein